MIKKLLSKKIWLAVIGVGILVIVFIIVGSVDNYNKQKEKEEIDRYTQEQLEIAGANQNSDDSLLMQMQPDLIKSYGKLPDGYIWNLDGTLLSLGDKSMSAEEVVYAYLNGLKSLDFSSVQKFSRDSVVVNTYENYFTELNKSTDYNDSFIRNIYRESLLSMQIDGIVNTSVFAENKQVFTVKVNMLDLTKKDFWLNDKEEIYKNLKIYSSDQSDSTKAEIYLYDYISRFYASGEADRRDVTFDITLQKYPDLDTGWLVSIDTDIDSACRYADGKLVVSYINEQFGKEGLDYLDALEATKETKNSEE
jgi:hypothetical protein